jgi:predicted alpha/beta hydrolase family esterase
MGAMARTRHLLFVQGGGQGAHDSWDNKLVASLEQGLGPDHPIHYPRMPDEADPDPAAWQKTIAREISEIGDDEALVLVGHSVGAAILLDYLACATLERRVAGIFLVAAPFIGDGGWPSEGLRPTKQLALGPHGDASLYFYQGGADDTVPISHIELFAAAFPAATVRRLQGRNHQLNDDLSEVAHDIALLK